MKFFPIQIPQMGMKTLLLNFLIKFLKQQGGKTEINLKFPFLPVDYPSEEFWKLDPAAIELRLIDESRNRCDDL